MATLTMKFSPLLLIFLSCFSNQIHALEGPEPASETHFHTVQLSSFLPASACTDPPTTKGHNKRESTIKVFSRHGPCFRQGQDKTATAMPSLTELFSHDQLRVDSIHARLAPKSNTNKVDESKVNLPVKSGRTLGSGNYVVTIGLGTPARTLSLVFDTGSDLTWTQCEPCIQSCYKQQDPIFNPSTSSSYSNISCNSAQCSQLVSATGHNPVCLSGFTCLYLILYGDSSFTIGSFSKDELTLSATEVIPNFLFGCGQINNKGLFGLTAGIIGLGRDPLSLVSQTAQQYGKYFSYCLPSLSSSTGYLSLGKSSSSNNVNFTPFVSSRGTSFYFIDIIAITIGGQQLPINQSVFKTAGTIIDSGTVITRLPPVAYSVMSSVFKQLMARYPSAPAASILDTCFDLSHFTTVTIPKVAFTFGGNAEVGLAPSGILIAGNSSIFCLAFAANKDATDVGIFGNTQQKTLKVLYDVAGGNLGFGTAGCS